MSEIIDTSSGEIVDTEKEVLKANLLDRWYQAVQAAAEAKLTIEYEQGIRKELAAMFFPTPDEGTNTYALAQGWNLKLTHKIDRKIDEAALEAVKVQLREINVNPDALINMKPSLDTKAYKGLKQVNPDAAKMFEFALIIKDASPTIELVAPKQKK